MKLQISFKIEADGKYVIAPRFIDLYPFGYIQAGQAKEGYRKWERKDGVYCPRCGLQLRCE